VSHGDLHSDDIVLRKESNGQLVVKLLDFGRFASSNGDSSTPEPSQVRADVQADIRAVGAILYEMLTGRSAVRQGRAAQAGSGEVPEVAQSLVPAIPHALARIVDQALATGLGGDSSHAIGSAKELAALLAPFAISERVPSLAPRNTLMPFLSQEARRSRGMARLERAVLGIGEQKPSNRPNLFVIEGAQDKVAKISERPSRAPLALAHSLNSEDLIEPRIPRAPRTPKHFGSVPRLIAADRSDGPSLHRKHSFHPLRRWKASRPKHARHETTHRRSKALSPVAMRIWSAGLLAAAGLGAGLLLAKLLHF